MTEIQKEGGRGFSLKNPSIELLQREAELLTKRNRLREKLGIKSSEYPYFIISFASCIFKQDPDFDDSESKNETFERIRNSVIREANLTPSVVTSLGRAANMLSSLMIENMRQRGGINLFSSKIYEDDAATETISYFKNELSEARNRNEQPQLTKQQEQFNREEELKVSFTKKSK